MSRPALVLVLLAGYLGLAFGLRAYLQYRRTGSTGFRGISGPAFSPAWLGGVLFVIALVAAVAAPVLAIAGVDPGLALPRGFDLLGGCLFCTGTVLLLWSQGAMGSSWRIGVDGAERTALVTGGPFAVVRNPIFTSMLTSAAGLALLLPNATAIAGFLIMLAAIELQVRFVEEPYLKQSHGTAYADYMRRVGRFVPKLGVTG